VRPSEREGERVEERERESARAQEREGGRDIACKRGWEGETEGARARARQSRITQHHLEIERENGRECVCDSQQEREREIKKREREIDKEQKARDKEARQSVCVRETRTPQCVCVMCVSRRASKRATTPESHSTT